MTYDNGISDGHPGMAMMGASDNDEYSRDLAARHNATVISQNGGTHNIISTGGRNLIVEDTVITNRNGSLRHVVKMNQKNIQLSSNYGTATFEVIRKSSEQDRKKGLGRFIPVVGRNEKADVPPSTRNDPHPQLNIRIDTSLAYYQWNKPWAIVLADDFICQAIPFPHLYVVGIPSRAKVVWATDKKEEAALDTLREMISEKDFRRYLKDGFITVESHSGKVYQVYRDRAHTRVWHFGQVVEEVCLRIKDPSIPRTDNVIAFKTMIETDESSFRQAGNVYNMRIA